ncbi:AAC(3) family N-acetyltransferase [Microlunatus parietis]|uniref:Aminoglycoside N(3)-acetyltransferase n=1 Tax=Microlunatus parietis TaxID=682979 RepID=A0A7Y9I4E1_9ACTN|nr:AAC(3) family N-acetyltransferase [Microlunatus parietis]NYE70053.1 aminoglycoside 3-N-acetyltransferase-4 [Microlunatus parietis]
MNESSVADLTAQLLDLGVRPGRVLLVHTSFRAVRPVQDGPAGLIAALRSALGPSGTLVMPSWTGDDDEPFDPASTPADPDLGVVAETFRRQPGVLRSDHPMAFAAAGPAAESITADPLPLPPHIPASPVGRVHDLDGQVLLLGVDHTANTTLHLAELIADVPYGLPKSCTVLEDGRPVRVPYLENDHCCQRFALAGDWLADKINIGTVGQARATLVRSRDIVDAVVPRLREDPLLFLHAPDDHCAECDAARASAARRS